MKPNGNDVRGLRVLWDLLLRVQRLQPQAEMEDDEIQNVAEAAPPSAPISDVSQPTLGSDPGEWSVE